MQRKPSGLTPKRSNEWHGDRSVEFKAHSFIIKVWIEEETNNDDDSTWRGHITHVPDGEQRYLQNLNEIESFVEPYLIAMGVRIGLRERIKRWLNF